MLVDVVADPDSFFAERDHDLRQPLGVVALTVLFAVLVGLWEVFFGIEHSAALAADSTSLLYLGGATVVMPAVWLSFVLLFYAGSFHVLAAILGETESFGASLAVAGWGFVPKLFVVVTNLSLLFLAGPAESLVLGSAGIFLPVFREALPLPMLAVSAYIWYHGLRATHDLDAWNAGLVVGVPVGLAFVVDLVALLASLLGLL